jgi:hypothetical protein
MRIASPREARKIFTKILVLPDLSHPTDHGLATPTGSRSPGSTTN